MALAKLAMLIADAIRSAGPAAVLAHVDALGTGHATLGDLVGWLRQAGARRP